MRLEEKEYTKSFDYSIWKRIFPFLKPYKKTVIMILVMNLFCSLVDIILPLFQRYAINHCIEGNTLTGIGFFTDTRLNIDFFALTVSVPLHKPYTASLNLTMI